MGGNSKRRWFISFSRSSTRKTKLTAPPKEFLCPITGSVMFDPVVITTGQTFERLSVDVCKNLRFFPVLPDGSHPDFSSVIPNLTLKSTILSWCKSSGASLPSSPDYVSVEKSVRAMFSEPIRISERELLKDVAENQPQVIHTHAVSELPHRVTDRFCSSSSEESVIVARSPGTPLPLKTRPFCYSSSSSLSEFYDFESPSWTQGAASPNPNPSPNPEEDELLSKLNSTDIFEHEKAVSYLRRTTRTNPEIRAALCTPWLLSALKLHLVSRYSSIQVNAVASVVNLSLEAPNRVKIVRSGTVPYLIDVLKGGSAESQSHAAGALFSLSIAEDNKMAIGALGALEPLLHALRSDSEQTRQDSALALYHLTLVSSNRVKLVNLNAIPNLLDMVTCGNLGSSKILLVLCNLAACNEGRVAMLECNGVRILVELLRGSNERGEESILENCLSALYSLSQRNFRFKLLLEKAKGVEVLREVQQKGGERAKEKVRRLLEKISHRDDRDGEGIDWETFLASGEVRRTRQLPTSADVSATSTEL